MSRPDRETAQPGKHDICKADRRETVDKPILEVDVKRDLRAHASHASDREGRRESSLLRPGFLRIQMRPRRARVAQLAEQGTLNPKVQGSTPCASTISSVLIRLKHDKSVPEDACQ